MKVKYKSSYYNIYRPGNKKIVFNTFTKASAEFDDSLFDILKNNELAKMDKTYIDPLLENGFIVEEDVNEYKVLKESFEKFKENKDTLYITLLPTFMCNFRCPYCFEGSESKNNTKIINFNILKKYAESNFDKYNHVHISLFGGEPLLTHDKNVDFLKCVKSLSKKKGFSFSSSITTNGYLLTEKVIEDLGKLNCQTIQITLDGYKNTHDLFRKLVNGKGTYDTIINNFKTLLKYRDKYNFNIMLRINLFNTNVVDIEKLLDEFSNSEKELFSIYFRDIYNTSEFNENNINKNELDLFYKMAESKGFHINIFNSFSFYHCEGGGEEEQIHILPNLKIYKCSNDLKFDKAMIGFIDKNGVVKYNDNLKCWKENNVFDEKKCVKCKFLPMCWGGCPLFFMKNGERRCIREKSIWKIEEGD